MLDFVPFFWVSLSNFVEESSKEKCIEMCLFYFILCPLDIVQFTLGYPQKCNSIICPLESSLKQQGSMSYRHCISFTWSSLLREVFLRQDQEKPWHIYCPASALLASGISCHFFDTMKTQSNLNVPKHETWILKTLEYINLKHELKTDGLHILRPSVCFCFKIMWIFEPSLVQKTESSKSKLWIDQILCP